MEDRRGYGGAAEGLPLGFGAASARVRVFNSVLHLRREWEGKTGYDGGGGAGGEGGDDFHGIKLGIVVLNAYFCQRVSV